MSAINVGFDKRVRSGYRAVDMRFGGQMDNCSDIFLGQQTIYGFRIAYVTVYEAEILLAPHRLKVRQISCVSERIQYYDTVLWMVLQPIMNEARTDEAGATSN